MSAIQVIELDTRPQHDPFRGGDAETRTQFWLAPEKRVCGVEQWRDDYCNGERYTGKVLDENISDWRRPTPSRVRSFLKTIRAQSMMNEVISGWGTEDFNRWNLTAAAQGAWMNLIQAIREL
jgi:hypothetical protein